MPITRGSARDLEPPGGGKTPRRQPVLTWLLAGVIAGLLGRRILAWIDRTL
ncbi:MAG TPA: hypothetical protein VNN19_00745 [bacterium]|nr:hypothetical protein [bacterium]